MLGLGNLIPGWKWFSALIGLAAFALVVVVIYDNFVAPPKVLADEELKVIDSAIPEVASEVQAFFDTYQGELRTLVMVRLDGDTRDGVITDRIRGGVAGELDGKGVKVFDTGLGSAISRAGSEAWRSATGSGDDDEDGDGSGGGARGSSTIASAEQALAYLEENADYEVVAWGAMQLRRVGATEAKVNIEVHLQARDPERRVVFQVERSSWDSEVAGGGGIDLGGVGGFLWRFLVFAVVGFFLPVALGPLTLPGFRIDSNAVNFLMLAGFTLANGVLVWALMGFAAPGGWGIVSILFAMVAGGFWNYRVLSEWERRA